MVGGSLLYAACDGVDDVSKKKKKKKAHGRDSVGSA